AALRDQSRLRLSHFNNLSFTGAIARNRCGDIVLSFDDALARQSNPRRGIAGLGPGRIELLRKSALGDLSFVLGDLHLQTRLSLFAAARAPITDRDGQEDGRGESACFF